MFSDYVYILIGAFIIGCSINVSLRKEDHTDVCYYRSIMSPWSPLRSSDAIYTQYLSWCSLYPIIVGAFNICYYISIMSLQEFYYRAFLREKHYSQSLLISPIQYLPWCSLYPVIVSVSVRQSFVNLTKFRFSILGLKHLNLLYANVNQLQ